MTEYLTEQEQIEIIKNWIKQYSFVILAGVAIAFVAVYSWRYWQDRQANILNHASRVYDEMLLTRMQTDAAGTLVQARKIFTHYPKTIYGQMAALMLARDAVYKKNYADAETYLNWILDHSNIPPIRQIARIRLARVLIAQQKSDAAIKLLQKVDDEKFKGLVEEVKGDAYLATQNTSMARQSYQAALTDLPNAEIIRPLLRMKYDNLATSASQ